MLSADNHDCWNVSRMKVQKAIVQFFLFIAQLLTSAPPHPLCCGALRALMNY